MTRMKGICAALLITALLVSILLIPGCAGADLTNQNSSEAAIFVSPAVSHTVLHGPPVPVHVRLIAGGFPAPMMVATPRDGSGRLFLVDQTGVVKIFFLNGTVLPVPFLNISNRIVPVPAGGGERGLLSLAFHPNFRTNGRVFVYYSAPLRAGAPAGWSCTNRLSEFTVSAANPNRINHSSERRILLVDKPAANHNGGVILFRPRERFLYLTLGDGGGGNDAGPGHTPGTGNAQDMRKLLGKVIRIDVDATSPGRLYRIPPDNPFVGITGVRPEIFASGLRNPAFAAFDAVSRRIFIADAGQRLFESVFITYKRGAYPWKIREGTHCFNTTDNTIPGGSCPINASDSRPLIGPIAELGHDLGNTVVGGVLYRGSRIPALNGSYVYGTWTSGTPGGGGNGTLLVSTPPAGVNLSALPLDANTLTPAQNAMWTTRLLTVSNTGSGRINAYIRGLSEANTRDILVLTSHTPGPGTLPSGQVWMIVPPAGMVRPV